MALYIYQSGNQPIGTFDVLDSYQSSILGGEVGTLYPAALLNTASELAEHMARIDGYDNTTSMKRPAVANTINTSSQRPLFLLDEGTLNYGTLFGQVIGAPTGLSTTSANLGPHTSAGSGKVTCWDKPGLYAVSVDAVDAATVVWTNASLTFGTALDVLAKGAGKGHLCVTGSGVGVTVGHFVEFEVSPFLVTTPTSLIKASHTPTRMIFTWVGLL